MYGIKIIIAFVIGFTIAQLVKMIVAVVRGEKNLISYLTKSGGMPSGHAASFVGATTVIGLSEGFTSSLFALAVCMAVIVLYDAVNVRYAVGEQGKELNKIIKKPLNVVEGHTVAEICVGCILGVIVGVLVWAIF